MFDFIKFSNADDVKAFQWFIENTAPLDAHPHLTVDMLWNFFHENGCDNLTSDIRLILDTFPQQQNLRDDEKAALKAILIMMPIDQRLANSDYRPNLLRHSSAHLHTEILDAGLTPSLRDARRSHNCPVMQVGAPRVAK